jgi:hypothetical protein
MHMDTENPLESTIKPTVVGWLEVPPRLRFTIGFPIDREWQEQLFLEANEAIAPEHSRSVMEVWRGHCRALIEQNLTTLDPLSNQISTTLGGSRRLDVIASDVLGREVMCPRADFGYRKIDKSWKDLDGKVHEKYFLYPELVLLGHCCVERATGHRLLITEGTAKLISNELQRILRANFVDVVFEDRTKVPISPPVLVNFDSTQSENE